MKRSFVGTVAGVVVVTAVGLGASRQTAPRVVLISVDGLFPADLRRAESAGVRLPVFDSLRRAGAFAGGVIGSFPSVTFPSHTTMVTGVRPARHGIFGNETSWMPTDTGAATQAWYWEADRVRVPTLFDLVHRAGGRAAAVSWPVTADDPSIAYNIPERWDPLFPGDSELVRVRRHGTPRLLDSLGAPPAGRGNDSLRAAWAAAILGRWDPDFLAVHLIELDGVKHRHGPAADSVWLKLAEIDRAIGWVLAVLRASARPTTVIITSDHGFLPIERRLRPGVLLANAGLVRFDSAGRLIAWDAGVQVSGGSATFIPRDPRDPAVAGRIRRAIPDALVGPGRPIRAVYPWDTLVALGGDTRAAWAIDMNAGFYTFRGFTGDLFAATSGGGHGFDPRRPELHAFFLAVGPGIRAGTTLPVIRQVDIAPTVAKVLGLRLEGVEGKALF